MENIKNIGDTITFTSNKGAFEAQITGRNWNGEHIMSYVVRHKGMDIPICPTTMRSQILH